MDPSKELDNIFVLQSKNCTVAFVPLYFLLFVSKTNTNTHKMKNTKKYFFF